MPDLLASGAGARTVATIGDHATNVYQTDGLDRHGSGWSDRPVVIANELYRRSAVDLLRTASALCPAG